MNDSPYMQTIQRLSNGSVASPRLEARLMLAFLLHTEADQITDDMQLTPSQAEMLSHMIKRRLKNEPLDKILGSKEFYKSRFIVSKDVLSPRPDTEILVEAAVRAAEKNKARTIADFGTGSGCIVLSVLQDCPLLTGTGIDRSEKALAIARQNARLLGLEARVRWCTADWSASDFKKHVPDRFDLIVTNPPYIPTAQIETLDPDVKNYDPLTALDGGADGCDAYRRIAALAPDMLTGHGLLLAEIGQGQTQDVCAVFEKYDMICTEILKDLAGIERCLTFQRRVQTEDALK
jgi:release factor glutamine methyltransferase